MTTENSEIPSNEIEPDSQNNWKIPPHEVIVELEKLYYAKLDADDEYWIKITDAASECNLSRYVLAEYMEWRVSHCQPRNLDNAKSQLYFLVHTVDLPQREKDYSDWCNAAYDPN